MSTELADDVVVDEAPSLRDTIEEAVETHAPEVPPVVQTPAPGSQTPAAKETGPQDRVAKEPVAQPPGAKPAAPAVTPPATPGAPTELKAPTQWRAPVREKWNQLPREVQEEVLRRENDTMRLVGSVGQKIRLADEVGAHLQEFAPRLEANGATSSQFMGDVFSTVKALAGGSALERAEIVANIVQAYGVDLRALDSVLTRRISAPPPDPRMVEVSQRAQRLEAQLQQQRSYVEQHQAKAAETTLQQFESDPKNEFFSDVRDLMADLMETGKASSLEDAYTAAIWANPDTRKILLQREAESRAAQKHQRANRARVVSSSVHGAPAVTGVHQNSLGSMSLRDTIAAAFDAQDAA